MRQRTLHPNYFTDAKLLQLSPLHRILFAGLWCLADREGKLEDSPLDIKIRVLPVDNCDVASMLVDLQAVGMIERYVVRDRAVIRVPNFATYQHPHPREMQSELPDPEGGGTTGKKRPRKAMPGTGLGNAQDRPRSDPSSTKALLGRAGSSGSSGSSVTGSSGSSKTDPPPPPTPSTENAVVVVEDAQGRKHDCTTPAGFWGAVSAFRAEHDLPRELEPPSWSAWYARATGEVGPELLLDAYVAYLRDDHFRDRAWPTAIFTADGVWRPRARAPEPERRRL